MREDDFEVQQVEDQLMLKQWVGDHKSAKHSAELVLNEDKPATAICRSCGKVAEVRA